MHQKYILCEMLGSHYTIFVGSTKIVRRDAKCRLIHSHVNLC